MDRARADAAMAGYRAGLGAVAAFVEEEYGPRARPAPGCYGMGAGGAEVYRVALAFHTTTSMAAEDLSPSPSP